MADIYIAVFIMAAISGLLFGLSLLLYRRITSVCRKSVAVGIIVLILVHLFVLSNSPQWTMVLPVKGIIVYSNLLILLNGFLSGFVWGNRKLSALRRSTAIGLLMFLAYLPTGYQIFPMDVPYHDIWQEGVCKQSSYTSCVPAAAATLLKYHGIDSSEKEMARLCLTRYEGTPLLGLYRALRIKTDNGSCYRVEIGKATVQQLQTEIMLPAILIITLDKETSLKNPSYVKDWGWQVDVSHAVVLFDFTIDGKVRIGDPAIGPETWTVKALEDLWHGEYIQLISR